jgi:hypothetical protein
MGTRVQLFVDLGDKIMDKIMGTLMTKSTNSALNQRPQNRKIGRPQIYGGNSVPAGFACVKSGKGHVAPVYSREISKIFLVKFQISDLCKIGRPQIYGGEFRSRSICMR